MKNILKENMSRFNTKNLSEQEMSYDEKVKKMETRKKVDKVQLLKLLPIGKTATIMQADGFLLIVDENNNYYELV
jgi:hypothetical protein